MNDTETWLESWHARHPGATSQELARCRPSSYEWLADRVAPGDRVLDLACGDGFLLELLRARGAHVTGVDFSAAELALARARLGPDVALHEARAQALPLPDAAFDCVTCHLALMLMLPIEPVVAELVRVLAPGGRLLAVVGDPPRPPRDDAWARLVHACVALPLQAPPLGDPRTATAEALRELLAPFAAVDIAPLAVDLAGPPARIWSLFTATYLYEMIPAAHVAAFDAAAQEILRDLGGPGGVVPCTLDLLVLEARK